MGDRESRTGTPLVCVTDGKREAAPEPLLDIAQAVRAGWLELWYQPKIDARGLAMRGAEALLHIRHPAWGIVAASYFIPNDGDPRFHPLSESVIRRAVEDWSYFAAKRGPIETAINLPIAFLQDPRSISRLCELIPDGQAFDGLIVEINATEIVRNLKLAKELASEFRKHKIAISIDNLGAEWLQLVGISNFPFVELKVDRKFIFGCADDPLKQSICRRIVELADGYGARTVAEGVQTWSDFLTVRDMGFDLAQGSLFAKPMSAEKFAQTCWAAPQAAPSPARSRSMEQLVFANRAQSQHDAREQPVRLSSQDADAQWR
jgi:EAL domain-containing protein (putative c-di-GMP-specific phosphodiesterase class I)